MYSKFVTTDEQHARARAKHFERHLEEAWTKRHAAVDPQWLNQWIQQNGPYLYHGTPTESVQNSILQHGLYPHDHDTPDPSMNMTPRTDEWGQEYIPSRSQWDTNYLRPRDGHVYLGTSRKASEYVEPGGGMVGIDLRKLDPSKINADEDAFQSGKYWDHPLVRQFYDPEHAAYDPPVDPDHWTPDMENFSQWADRIGLGQNPEETHHSLANHGSIAYNGVIPPEAIVPGSHAYHSVADRWEEAGLPVAAHVAAADDSLHIGLPIPRNAASHIQRWVKDQQWPEGTEIESPSEYHITLLFAPQGHEEHSEGWWVKHLDKAKVKITGFDVFPSGENEDLNAYVLRVESPEVEDHANKLMDSAEWAGLEPSRFPGGYKAHITVAYGPGKPAVQAPELEFDVGPSEVSPRRYQKQTKWERTAYTPDDVQILDHLSLSSVAHNIHYKFEQGTTDPHGLVEYAKRLLNMVGYPDDKVTTQAALQAWQQLYPQDQVLTAPDVQPQISSPVQKNLPSAQANYHKDSVSRPWMDPNLRPSWWDEEPELDPAMRTSDPAFQQTQGEAMAKPGSASAMGAYQHLGQIPGDEHYINNRPQIQAPNPNRGVNPSYLGHAGEQEVYIKPESNFHANDVANERAAFAVGHTLGVPVPHTVVMPVETSPGSGSHLMSQVQASVPGTPSLMFYRGSSPVVTNHPEDARKIALLDNVIANEDRHNGNMVVGDDGRLYPIDHGGSFDSTAADEYYPDAVAGHFSTEDLRPDEIEALKRVKQLDLRQMGLSRHQHAGMLQRVDNMLSHGKLNALSADKLRQYGYLPAEPAVL